MKGRKKEGKKEKGEERKKLGTVHTFCNSSSGELQASLPTLQVLGQ